MKQLICQKCGNCCSYRAELGGGLDDIPEELTEVVEEDNRIFEVMKMVNDKCIALSNDNKCTIYDRRPIECRDFLVGESRCSKRDI